MLKLIVLFALLCPAFSAVLNCLNPWQTEMKSGLKNVACSATSATPCAKGRNGVCVFTYVSFSYICCEDIANITTPTCPKYYDTLKMTCDLKSPNACPYNYQCMLAKDTNYTVCCSYNPNLNYPEPANSFADLEITPKYLPIAPTVLLKVQTTAGMVYKLGQEVQAGDLATAPTIVYTPKDNNTYYTLLIFDISIAAPAGAINVVANAVVRADNRTYIDFATTPAAVVQAWTSMAAAKPSGTHVLVFALFEQKAPFLTTGTVEPLIPKAADTPTTAWNVASFLTKFNNIGNIVAGTYLNVIAP